MSMVCFGLGRSLHDFMTARKDTSIFTVSRLGVCFFIAKEKNALLHSNTVRMAVFAAGMDECVLDSFSGGFLNE